LLRGGLVTTASALRSLWWLEDHAYQVMVDSRGRLDITPPGGERIPPEIDAAIRRYRDALMALVNDTPDDTHLFRDDVAASDDGR